MSEFKYPFKVNFGFVKRQINNVKAPEKNHPIHDAATVFSYAKGKYHLCAVFDGVSESKSREKATVNISKELAWNLESFCRHESPENMHEISEWFQKSINDEKYKDKGATTISLIRFNAETGEIDGMTVGDSPALMVKADKYEDEYDYQAQILSALHVVANNPGVITRQWRFDQKLNLTIFKLNIPDEFDRFYLISLSDGYGKLSDENTVKYIDDDIQDMRVSLFYPYFSKVYLPKQVIDKFPDIPVDNDGATPYLEVDNRPEIQNYLAEIYETLGPEEQKQISIVDLDTAELYEFYRDPEDYALRKGIELDDIFLKSHPALSWMLSAPYDTSKDEQGLDEYLREYISCEIFTVGMLDELLSGLFKDVEPLQKKLNKFINYLDPIADDFSIAMLEIIKK